MLNQGLSFSSQQWLQRMDLNVHETRDNRLVEALLLGGKEVTRKKEPMRKWKKRKKKKLRGKN